MKTWVRWAFVAGVGLFLIEFVLGARDVSQVAFIWALVMAAVGMGILVAAALMP